MLYLFLGSFIGMLLYRAYLWRQLEKPRKQAIISPDDMNKEPKHLLNVMDKVYLKLLVLDHPEFGIQRDIDHRKELLENVDEYMSNMRPFTVTVNNSLEMPKSEYAHIGYYFQGDMYDLDGKHLYESKRWVKDLNKNFPWNKKGIKYAITNAISSLFKRS